MLAYALAPLHALWLSCMRSSLLACIAVLPLQVVAALGLLYREVGYALLPGGERWKPPGEGPPARPMALRDV